MHSNEFSTRSGPDDDWETTCCPLGCEPHDTLVVSGRDRLNKRPGIFSVVRCTHCGLMRTNPRPTPESMPRFYPAEYGPFRPVTRSRSALANWARARFPGRMQEIPEMSPGRLLELGCSVGDFLQGKQDEGWEVEGVEPSSHAAGLARSRGLNVHQASAEEVVLTPPGDGYDLIAAWMVLEHTHEPLIALARAREWVKPGGLLALSVPDAGSVEFSLFRDAWYALQLPTHLFHFTADSLTLLLQHSGWQVEDVIYHRTLANAVASLGYRIADHLPTSRFARACIRFPESHRGFYATYPLAWAAAELGQTGRITAWGRAI